MTDTDLVLLFALLGLFAFANLTWCMTLSVLHSEINRRLKDVEHLTQQQETPND